MSFTPAFNRPIRYQATCIGGPLSGKVIPVEGTHAKVILHDEGHYEWVCSRPAWDSQWIGMVWFAVWFPRA